MATHTRNDMSGDGRAGTVSAPLSGVVVFDFTRHLAGPFATQILRDLGARVIKFEPATGDPARRSAPFQGQDSAYFHPINRGKESVVVDFSDPDDIERILQLMPYADCVVENFRPGVMDEIGLGAAACLRANPRIIFAACSGFGADGPYATRPAFDVVVQAMGGVMSVTGQPDGPPTRVGVSQGDITAGVFLALAVLAGIVQRQATGAGSVIDASMLEAQLSLMTHAFGIRVATGQDPVRTGSRHPAVAPFDVFAVSDGYVAVGVVKDETFEAMCKALGIADVADDPRFSSRKSRLKHADDLTVIITEAVSSYTMDGLVAILTAESVPCGPVLTVSDLLSDPHVAARQALGIVRDWGDGGLAVPGLPFKLDGIRPITTERGPDLGALPFDALAEELAARAAWPTGTGPK